MSDKMTVAEAVQICGKFGIKITGLPKRRATLPLKKMGVLADELHNLRELRLSMQRVVDAVKREETRLTDHIIENVDMETERGVMGTAYKAMVMREEIPIIEDSDAFYTYVKKTNSFHFLTKALNRGAIRDAMEATNKGVPGIGTFSTKKISLTKV